MTMPIDLVLVRHGQSEGNVAVKTAESGDNRHFTEEYRRRHNSVLRLSDKGIAQAKSAGDFIKKHVGDMFDRQYMSHYLRAQETALHLNLPNKRWREDIFIRERSWGDFDSIPADEREQVSARAAIEKDTNPFYWRPPNGESIADVAQRLKSTIIDTLHRECSDMRVVMVCHGEIMWAFRFLLEGMTVGYYHKIEASRDPKNRMRNCQVLWYTRRDSSARVTPKFQSVTMVCPWDYDPKTFKETLTLDINYEHGRGNVSTS